MNYQEFRGFIENLHLMHNIPFTLCYNSTHGDLLPITNDEVIYKIAGWTPICHFPIYLALLEFPKVLRIGPPLLAAAHPAEGRVLGREVWLWYGHFGQKTKRVIHVDPD